MSTYQGFCCLACTDKCGLPRKAQQDSNNQSWLCKRCGHYGIGSYVEFETKEWLVLHAVKYIKD